MVLIISDDINHDDAIFDRVMTQGKVLMMMVLIICVENYDGAIFDNVMTQGKVLMMIVLIICVENHDDAIFMTHRVSLKMVLGRVVVEGREGPSRASSK